MRIELPEKKKLVMEMPMPIRWGDMDAMGHVNSTLPGWMRQLVS